MRILTRSRLLYSLALASLIGLGVGVVSVRGLEAGWLPGLIVFVVYLLVALRRPMRRWRATRNALRRESVDWLNENVELYTRLDQEARARFHDDVCIILNEWTFEGVGPIEVTDEMRLSVAAGAALLLHGRPDWELPYRQTVLFYPEAFDDEYAMEEEGEFDGMAHWQGPIILSARSMADSWAKGDGNVVLHELAHLLDYKTEFADGVPSLIDARSSVAWEALVRREMARIERRDSVLDSYGATEPAEFFAVAVETFFEEPELLASHHAELFVALGALFNLDPRTGQAPAENHLGMP